MNRIVGYPTGDRTTAQLATGWPTSDPACPSSGCRAGDHRPKLLFTPACDAEVEIPKLRIGSFRIAA